MVNEAVRQLEAGRRHPLERLVQSWRHVTHVVLLAAAAHEPPAAIGSRRPFPALTGSKYSEVLWAGMPTGGVGSLLAVTPLW